MYGLTRNTAVLLAILIAARGQRDLTRLPKQSGKDVTQAVVDAVVQSEIFPADSNFLRRIACVESRDGTDPNTYRDGYDGGIWQVDRIGFEDTQNTAAHPDLVDKFAKIQQAFEIDWQTVQWSDLHKPLYSAIAARLFLSNIPKAIPNSADIAGQAAYWKRYYNTAAGVGAEHDFVERVKACEVQECAVEGIDLAFAMDGSGSVGSGNFDTAKIFVTRVADGFNIGPNNTRVGVIQYSSSPVMEFDFDDFSTNADVQAAVTAISYQGGGTHTGAAISHMTSTLFDSSRGARLRSLNIPRVAVIITDGRSGDSVLGPANAARDADITMFAIGVANYDQGELDEIANDPNSEFAFTADNFNVIENIRNLIGTAACRVPVEVPINVPIEGTLDSNGVRYASYPIPPTRTMTLKLETPSGEGAYAYFSTQIRNPSAALYDWMLETDPAQPFDQVFINFNSSQVNKTGVTYVFATIASKAAPTGTNNTNTHYSLVGEEGNSLIPVSTIPPSEFPCSPNTPCANGGTCVWKPVLPAGGSINNYMCHCRACYTGQRCEIDNSGCANVACQNGGQCTPFHNSCSKSYCSCPACFYGRFCDKRIDACWYHRCQNGGICVSSQGTCRTYQCLCPDSFSGPLCEIPLCDPGCLNGAECVGPNTCKCMPGFVGRRCETMTCQLDCLNGGYCQTPDSCTCQPGYTGRTCAIAICDPHCRNGGECTRPGQCMCPRGFSGETCETGQCSVSCQNGGICVRSNMCRCPKGYKGRRCELPSCEIRCQNGGRCVKPNRCTCPSGYKGRQCHKAVCVSGCLNGGRCIRPNVCSCKPGYEGSRCETDIRPEIGIEFIPQF
ncbi:uncharacterized protein [Amphiura filiformis]|uniref:uncharacterized protein isoform X1 n=1 Tax=Amphiura filiformis TaxID=82378 RepID=UPI003B21F410